MSVTPYGGFNAQLTRAPYVTDLTQTSADVTWATTVSTLGTLKWGTGSNCTATSVAVPSSLPTLVNGPSPTSATARDFTVGSLTEYQSTVTISGLSPNTTYCYRIFLGTTDLLGSSNSSPTFTTLAAAGASSSVSFDVVGDLGETYYTTSGAPFPGAAPNYNPDQAAIDKLIGTSGAQFLLTAGDVGYSGGTQTDYGDLQQTGPEVSDMFGPSYWPETGGIPTFGSVGNHGQNVDSLRNWPESNTTSASGGVYAYDSYPGGVDGTAASSAPDEWYAFSTGNVRIYVLDAGWANGNVGTADIYKVDYDNHWAPGSPEYQWLANDLASHPGGVKMAVFHFPLRSDNSTESSDVYLQNSSANPNASTSLEALLAANGVSIAFNGHAHTYQRINPRVTGRDHQLRHRRRRWRARAGGRWLLEPLRQRRRLRARLEPHQQLGVRTAASASSTPTSAAQVYNFLKVTVTGSTIVVNARQRRGPVLRHADLHGRRQLVHTLDTRNGHRGGNLVDVDPGQLEPLDRDRRDHHRLRSSSEGPGQHLQPGGHAPRHVDELCGPIGAAGDPSSPMRSSPLTTRASARHRGYRTRWPRPPSPATSRPRPRPALRSS